MAYFYNKLIFAFDFKSLVVISFSVSDVVAGVDGEICRVDVVSFDCSFEELGVVNRTVLLQIDLLVLYLFFGVHLDLLRNI